MMRRQVAYVDVKFTTQTGVVTEFEQRVEATCTDNATHLICHNVKMDYPTALDVVVKFKRWGEINETV